MSTPSAVESRKDVSVRSTTIRDLPPSIASVSFCLSSGAVNRSISPRTATTWRSASSASSCSANSGGIGGGLWQALRAKGCLGPYAAKESFSERTSCPLSALETCTSSAMRSSTLPTPGSDASASSPRAPPSRSSPTCRSMASPSATRRTVTWPLEVWVWVWAAIASATRSASSRRSTGHCARAASMPTTRERTGATSGPLTTRTVASLPVMALPPFAGPRSAPSGTPNTVSRGRSTCVTESEAHPHLRAFAVVLAQFERLGERRDEGQAKPETRGVGPRHDPPPLVPHDHREVLGRDVGGDLHRPLAAVVGVHHDVRAGLGHGQLDVRERLRIEVERLAESADGMAYDGHVLGAGGKGQLDVGHRVTRGIAPSMLPQTGSRVLGEVTGLPPRGVDALGFRLRLRRPCPPTGA